MIPDIQNPFFSDVARGVEDFAYANDYAVILCSSDEQVDKQNFYLNTMLSEYVDGIILPPISGENALVTKLSLKYNVPIVCIDRRFEGAELDTIVVDNRDGAFMAVEHLIRLGHRRIGIITGLSTLSSIKERRLGFMEALSVHDIPLLPHMLREGDSRYESGKNEAGVLLDMKSPPSALFVCNNLMTLGAFEAIHQRGVQVPGELSLIGFDDMPWAPSLHPPLTAIRQPSYKLGYQAAEMLLDRIRNPHRPTTTVVLPSILIERQSCGRLMANPDDPAVN